ncbi:hypothetical protein A2886_02910 [candidate division WWE3 bacterium RIFCSPHIGHO2_01_FULL_42_13]|uniref:Uncharacterized protein n=1 Tax=candidate division WWE3 bacterium RIFCSPHIGHO2_01_FULL_42_13 TaxID=1802617 RepID=A0A1F4USD1_UNCKA|nr:MAG: hypothetical protein A2886_02910 [candidate division WWE3 bacterium RIFCSPHIGHO2_01_FULL_42_13]
MDRAIGKIRPTIYFCEICKKEFRAKRGERGGNSAKKQAAECSLLPAQPFKFKVGARVVSKVQLRRRKRLGKRPKYSRYSRLPVYVVLKQLHERRGKFHINVYMVEREGGTNDIKTFFYERGLEIAQE